MSKKSNGLSALRAELNGTGRDTATGRFTTGNTFGPGRPCRSTELSYLRIFSDELSEDAWRSIVKTAIERAKAGDEKAREWIAKLALGSTPATLARLAAYEALGIKPEHLVLADADEQVDENGLDAVLSAFPGGESQVRRALRFAEQEQHDSTSAS